MTDTLDSDLALPGHLTVRLGAIAANYRGLRQLAGAVAAAAVVKADAYGMGAARAAPVLAEAGCDTFFVARLEEGIALRAAVPQARIFVLDGAPGDAAPALIAHRLTPVLNSPADVAAWSDAATSGRRTLDAAVHVDTGMNRLGFSGEELALFAAEAKARLAELNLVLVMSHLACADDGSDDAMNRRQLERFRAALAMLPPAPASLAATSGILLGRDYHFDMVRPGVGLYGGGPATRDNPRNPVAIVTARVLQTRRIDKGDSVGYAATFHAKRPSMIATVAAGYADGIMRTASRRGVAAIRGARAPYAGRVSMDMLSLDITDLQPAPAMGDWCELMGDTITLAEVAEFSGTNEYEILTGLAARLPRRYTDDAA
jgi:alanine racemase